MDGKQLRQLKPELDMFLDRYLPLFGREENHRHAERFVHGLLGGQERRNVENIVLRHIAKTIYKAVWAAREVFALQFPSCIIFLRQNMLEIRRKGICLRLHRSAIAEVIIDLRQNVARQRIASRCFTRKRGMELAVIRIKSSQIGAKDFVRGDASAASERFRAVDKGVHQIRRAKAANRAVAKCEIGEHFENVDEALSIALQSGEQDDKELFRAQQLYALDEPADRMAVIIRELRPNMMIGRNERTVKIRGAA